MRTDVGRPHAPHARLPILTHPYVSHARLQFVIRIVCAVSRASAAVMAFAFRARCATAPAFVAARLFVRQRARRTFRSMLALRSARAAVVAACLLCAARAGGGGGARPPTAISTRTRSYMGRLARDRMCRSSAPSRWARTSRSSATRRTRTPAPINRHASRPGTFSGVHAARSAT